MGPLLVLSLRSPSGTLLTLKVGLIQNVGDALLLLALLPNLNVACACYPCFVPLPLLPAGTAAVMPARKKITLTRKLPPTYIATWDPDPMPHVYHPERSSKPTSFQGTPGRRVVKAITHRASSR